MLPYLITGFCLLACVGAIALRLAYSRLSRVPDRPHDELEDFAAGEQQRRLDRMRTRLSQPVRMTTNGEPLKRREFGAREKRPRVYLTRKELESVNLKRQRAGKPMLSSRGFGKAVQEANGETLPPRTQSDWLTYFLLYEVIFDNDTSRVPASSSGLSIDHRGGEFIPEGGSYGGAGATGSWDATKEPFDASAAETARDIYAPVAAAAAVSMAAEAVHASAEFTATNSPDPTPPSYSPPASDPAPYSAPDSGSSVSIDTGSVSVSVDTGGSF